MRFTELLPHKPLPPSAEEQFIQSFEDCITVTQRTIEEKNPRGYDFQDLVIPAREKFLTQTFEMPAMLKQKVQPIIDLALHSWTRSSIVKMSDLYHQLFPKTEETQI